MISKLEKMREEERDCKDYSPSIHADLDEAQTKNLLIYDTVNHRSFSVLISYLTCLREILKLAKNTAKWPQNVPAKLTHDGKVVNDGSEFLKRLKTDTQIKNVSLCVESALLGGSLKAKKFVVEKDMADRVTDRESSFVDLLDGAPESIIEFTEQN